MVNSSRLALQLNAAGRLSDGVASAAAAGLGTGAKAIVNGSATAIKNVATLGLNTRQLELIGVTKEDRARGYDTAVKIATASGETMIAVCTAGTAAALSKGGTVARVASGALVAFDSAGNAAGVVQGTYDAAQNGRNLSNGAQIAGGLLGLAANAQSLRNLSAASAARNLAEVEDYIAKCPRKTTPAGSPSGLFEIQHTGRYNYAISGGGETFDIDGYRGTTILEAKYVGKPLSSPYVPGSSLPDAVRESVLEGVRKQLAKVRTIIASGEIPFKRVEFITNSPEAKALFEKMLKEHSVPGSVRLAL